MMRELLRQLTAGSLVVLVWLRCVPLAAAPITPPMAKSAAEAWLRGRVKAHMGAQFRSAPLEVTPGLDKSGRTLFYAVGLEGSGYVVTSADDELEPIVAFSDSGSFRDAPENPLASLLRRDMAERTDLIGRSSARRTAGIRGASSVRTERIDKEVAEAAGRCRAAWASLLDEATNAAPGESRARLAQSRSSVSDVRVPALMSTKWNQSLAGGSACYNYYTPNGYVCGCVATAGAQLMRYHRHPTGSLKTFSASCWVDDVVRTMSTKGGAFDWGNMPDAPGSSATAVQRQAIGKLCYDAGVAARMNWTDDGSGAMLPTLGENLVTMFGYAQARSQLTGSLTVLEMRNAIYANLDAGCPVLLGIEDSNGKNGHAIVADGYGYDGLTVYTHLNLGWAGSSDAWYALPDIGTTYKFSCVDTVIYNVFPNRTGELLTGRVTAADGTPVSGATVRATYSDMTRTAVSNGRGIYAIYLEGGRTWNVVVTASGYGEATASAYVASCKDCEITKLTSSGCSYYRGSVGNSWGNDFKLVKGASVSLEIDPVALSFSSSSGSQTVNVSCSGNWQAESSGAWVTLGATSGSGNGTLRVSVAANGQLQRTATVVVSCGTVRRSLTVSQKGVSKYGHLTIDDGTVVAWDGLGGTDVVIPEGVVGIGEDVFKSSTITSVKFPNSLERIGAGAFGLCYSLTNVTWGTGLKTIGGQAFGADHGLTGCLTLPDGVRKIEYCAFWGIDASWIVLPASIEQIDWGAFNACPRLSRVYFEGDAPALGNLSYYDLTGGQLVSSSEIFQGNDEQMRVMVPYGSRGWNSPNSSTLPAQWPVGDIASGDAREIAHYDATVTKLALDQGVVQLLGQGQTIGVGVQAQDGWWASTDVSWISFDASSGTGFSTLAFKVSENRQTVERKGAVTVRSGNAQVVLSVRQSGMGEEFLIEDGVLKQWLDNGSGRAVIPSGVREIGEKAFYQMRDLKEVVLPDSVRKIGDDAFGLCSSLTNVVMGFGLEEIGEFAFCLDSALCGRLRLPDSLKRIGYDAFWETGYSVVDLPGGMENIGGSAFKGCAKLEAVYFRGDAPETLGERYMDAPHLYTNTDPGLTTYVAAGSRGWVSAGSAALPSLWPVGDDDARPIASYDPTVYTICFDGGTDGMIKSTAILSRACKRGVVYTLDKPYGLASASGKRIVGWACSNGRRYDPGVLFFNLAEPGETVTMTAIWE